MKKFTAAFGLMVALAACSTNQPMAPAATANTLPPKLTLDVQNITLTDRSGMQPANSPYNDNRFSPTIDEAIKRWASDRLQAAGQSGQAIVLIKDATLTSESMPMKSGIDSWFTRQQAIKYVAHAEVAVEANGRPGFATADAVATRAVTLPENPTAVEKQDAYDGLLKGLMKDLGQNLDAAIQTHMSNFIMATPIFGTTAMPIGGFMGGNSGDSLPPAPPTPASVAPASTAPAVSAAPMPDTSGHGQAVIPLSGAGR